MDTISTNRAREALKAKHEQSIRLQECKTIFQNEDGHSMLNNSSDSEIDLLGHRIIGYLYLQEGIKWSKSYSTQNTWVGACANRKAHHCDCKFAISIETGTLNFTGKHSTFCLKNNTIGRPPNFYITKCLVSPTKIAESIAHVEEIKERDISLTPSHLKLQVKIEAPVQISEETKLSIVRRIGKSSSKNEATPSSPIMRLIQSFQEEGIPYSTLKDGNGITTAVVYWEPLLAPSEDDIISVVFSDVTFGIIHETCGFRKLSLWVAFINGELKPLGNSQLNLTY